MKIKSSVLDPYIKINCDNWCFFLDVEEKNPAGGHQYVAIKKFCFYNDIATEKKKKQIDKNIFYFLE